MTIRIEPRYAVWPAVFSLCSLLVGGCGDESEKNSPSPARESERQLPQRSKAALRTDWLAVDAPQRPAQWLVSRGAGAVRPAEDPEVRRLDVEIRAASQAFGESERMIANRSVQLEAMLKEKSIDADAISLLRSLASVNAAAKQNEGFGALVQHYFILRLVGNGHDAVTAILRERYANLDKRVPQ